MIAHYKTSFVDGGHDCFQFENDNDVWMLSSCGPDDFKLDGKVYVIKTPVNGDEEDSWIESID